MAIDLLAARPDESVLVVLKLSHVFIASSTALASRSTRRELSIHGLGMHGDWDLMLWHNKRLSLHSAADFTN